MTIETAISLFENLKNNTSKKSEIKVYDKYLSLLNGLNSRELSNDEIQSIETKLESLNLTSDQNSNKTKFFKKALADFEKFLRETFSFSTKGYYTTLGTGLGISFGLLFGIVFLSSFERSMGISLGISIGMLIGLLIGRNLDERALAAGNVIP